MNEFAKSQVGAKVAKAACPAPTAYEGGSALVFYNSTSYRDDLVWAAAWLYKATGEPVSGFCACPGLVRLRACSLHALLQQGEGFADCCGNLGRRNADMTDRKLSHLSGSA